MKFPFFWKREPTASQSAKAKVEAPKPVEEREVELPVVEPSVDFALFPWDRKRPRGRVPQSNHTLEWNGQTYGLRAKNGLLFLRAVGDAKTWIVATPLKKEQQADVENFPIIARAALESGDIARFVMAFDPYLERGLALFFRNDGSGFCRESWNCDDFPFEHGVTERSWKQDADEVLAAHISILGEQFLYEPMSEMYGHDRRVLEWICGSREQLEELAHWICWSEPALWVENYELELSIRSENEFSRACVEGLWWENGGPNGEDYFGWTFYRDQLTDELESASRSDNPLLPALTVRWSQLFDLAFDENTPVGLDWEYRDYGSGRCANEPYSEEITFKVPTPSDEQQIEARRALREWLIGKVPLAEIEAIMNDETTLEVREIGG